MEEQLKEIIDYFTARLTALFLSEEDFRQLYDLAVNVQENGRILEIGAGAGCSMVTMAIASKTRGIELTTIDLFQYANYLEYGYNITKESALDKFLENMKFWGLDIKLLREQSASACKKIEDKSVDLLFIDGSHQYSEVKADIINYSPKVKNEGILCGHDYQKCHPGVRKAVDEIFGKNGFRVLKNSSIWVKK